VPVEKINNDLGSGVICQTQALQCAVIPAKASPVFRPRISNDLGDWIPALAGMTRRGGLRYESNFK